MSAYRLLAIDIDGTLVNSREELSPATCTALRRAGKAGIYVVLATGRRYNSREELSPATCTALRRAGKAGIYVVLATGRRYGRALHLAEPLGIDVPLVAASGALVKDPRDHRTLFRAEFEPALLLEALSVIADNGYDPVVCADTYSEGFEFYHARARVESPELAEYLRMNPGCGRLWPDLVSRPPPGVFTCFAMGTRQQMLQLDQTLHRRLPGTLQTHVLRSPRYTGFMCEFAPRGVTKWSAIRRLAADWGVDERAICAVGDDVNDIPMIRAAGLGVAMGNALPEVKNAADRIAPSQAADGLVEVVQWLLD